MDELGIIRLILMDARMQATAARNEYEAVIRYKNQSAGNSILL